MSQLVLTCYARAEPQGSSRAFMHHGKALVTSNNKKLKPFRQELASTAIHAMRDQDLYDLLAPKHVPVGIHVDIYLQRPPSIPKKRTFMVVKPDLDKLIRAIKDSLTGIVWQDDSQVCEVIARKHYGSPERVELSVYTL